jgi:hypothetical protein
MPLPELAAWGGKHPKAQKIARPTLNKLLGGVQTVALWARNTGMVPEDLPWSDPFSKMRLKEAGPDRDAFTIGELNTLLASSVFSSGSRRGGILVTPSGALQWRTAGGPCLTTSEERR